MMSINESNQRFELLRTRYASSLADKRQDLSRAWHLFEARPVDESARQDLQRQIHRLSGSAPAYGYERLGDRARVVDTLLRTWDTTTPSLRDAPTELAERIAAPVRAILADLAEASAKAVLPDAEVPINELRVLLVEDDAAQAMLTAAELEARGCTVRIESGAETLWQTLTLWPCHAAVLDYWLHGETAAEVAAMLRREPRFARLAVVCFSVERNAPVLRAVLDAGCDAVSSKADGIDRLLEVVRASVARKDRGGRAVA